MRAQKKLKKIKHEGTCDEEDIYKGLWEKLLLIGQVRENTRKEIVIKTQL